MRKKRLYLDHNATTPLLPEVANMMRKIAPVFGNSASLHEDGRRAHALIEDARDAVARALAASSEQVVFCASGTEANNMVLKQLLYQRLQGGRPHLITSKIEHASVRATAEFLAKMGIDVTYVPVDSEGQVDVAAIGSAITAQTALISVMTANNEVGTIQPLRAISDLAHKAGVKLHTDAVQALGKLPLSVSEIPVDFMTVTAHKIYGPKGAAALYIRDPERAKPLLHGGSHERLLRAGTQNVAAIAGFGLAARLAAENINDYARHLESLASACRSQLKKTIPDLVFLGQESGLPGTLAIAVPRCEGHALAIRLDLAGLSVSTGSACSSGSPEPSSVLMAMGLDQGLLRSGVRLSFGRDNRLEDVPFVVAAFKDAVQALRSA